jgi:hypothetical protein
MNNSWRVFQVHGRLGLPRRRLRIRLILNGLAIVFLVLFASVVVSTIHLPLQ